MKLNLGCWHRYIPGFIHVDLCDMPHIDHISNIDNLPFISDESVDLIYVSHAFEDFEVDLHSFLAQGSFQHSLDFPFQFFLSLLL